MSTKFLGLGATALALMAIVGPTTSSAAEKVEKSDSKQIAEEAFIYGFPIVMNYGVVHEYFIDKSSGQYKCPFNQIYNMTSVATPKDTAIVTPNSDTPYSFVYADLRAEPIVLSVPQVEKTRYYSVQLIDMYTFNYGYMGSRTTGADAGTFMIVGPNWKGEKPAGIKKVFECETDFTFAVFRTQLFNPRDMDNVKKVQAGYKVQKLSEFLKKPAPAAAPKIEWPKIDKELAERDPFAYLNFVLQFCPPVGPVEVEKQLRAKFAKLGIEAGKPFSVEKLTAEQKRELEAGVKSGLEKIKKELATFGKDENGWRVSTTGFGDRDVIKGNWTERAAAAMQLLIDNPINRYLINSPMLPDMKKNGDGSLTLYLQKGSPGKDKESNWLPAPDGPIYVVMRLYWPKEAALKGEWKPPAVMRTK